MLTSLSLALALAAGQSAEAPPPPPEGERHMIFTSGDGPSRDADNDGFVSREEFMAPLADAFGRLDKDGDGRLSADEREDAHGEMRMRHPHPMAGAGPMPMMLRHHGAEGGEVRTIVVEQDGEGPARVTVNGRPVEGDQRIEVVTAEGGPGRGGHPMIMRRGADGEGEQRTITVERRGDGPAKVVVDGREVEGDEASVVIREMEGGPDGLHVMMRRPGPGGEMAFHSDGDRNVIVRRIGGPGDAGLDKDGDGKVSEEEFLAPVRDAFREMDADHSGALEDGEHGPRHD